MVKLAKTLPNHDLENLDSIRGSAQTTAVRVLAELGDLVILIKSMLLSELIQADISQEKWTLI